MSKELKPCICGKCEKKDDCVTAKLNNVSACVRYKEVPTPCPFCKGEDFEIHKHGRDRYCECRHCHAAAKVSVWNTRPSPWIAITPTTIPEHKQDVWVTDGKTTYVAKFCDGDLKPMFFGVGITWEVDDAITHYQPITLPPIPEKG